MSSQILVYVSSKIINSLDVFLSLPFLDYLRMGKLIYLKIIKLEPNVTWLQSCLMRASMKVSLIVGGELMFTALVSSFGNWPEGLNLDKAEFKTVFWFI